MARLHWRHRLAASLLTILPTTHAVALSDFSPSISTLTGSCSTAYCTPIPGCTARDFAGGSSCSASCLSGLVQINALIASSCAGIDVGETSIVGLFKLGKGIQVLCNVAVITTTTGTPKATPKPAEPKTTPPLIGQSTLVLSSNGPEPTGLLTDTALPSAPSTTALESTTLKTSTTKEAETKGSTTNGIVVDTSSPSPKSTQAAPTRAQGQAAAGGTLFDTTSGIGRLKTGRWAFGAAGLVGGLLLL
ncbi:hypothetical protein EJ06DRAFT_139791 [Trichodelitschia bisporula]|uniref:Extracellular membrane protein CFEM domain-containing protein n=1 Tax=Trichodelitschia bisporula TaxID=703511 RepID=A0A6G1HPH5_9PEZI|nr:hypothetical protein EJ06DRAFT_139791 [Trichodelitschia bisporula]